MIWRFTVNYRGTSIKLHCSNIPSRLHNFPRMYISSIAHFLDRKFPRLRIFSIAYFFDMCIFSIAHFLDRIFPRLHMFSIAYFLDCAFSRLCVFLIAYFLDCTFSSVFFHVTFSQDQDLKKKKKFFFSNMPSFFFYTFSFARYSRKFIFIHPFRITWNFKRFSFLSEGLFPFVQNFP